MKSEKTLSVRLPQETMPRLEEVAALEGKSVHKCIESIVCSTLHSMELWNAIRQELRDLKKQMIVLSADVQRLEERYVLTSTPAPKVDAGVSGHKDIVEGLHGLRAELRLATCVLLCNAGKAEPEEAEQFVRDYFTGVSHIK